MHIPTKRPTCFHHNLLLLLLLTILLHFPDIISTYSPIDTITVNCGTTGGSNSFDKRSWIGDISSRFSPTSSTTESQTSTGVPAYSSGDPVPYSTARISNAPFTYSFPVTSGQKFIRLYFYPASYAPFNNSKPLFSVTANKFTLLHDFNAGLQNQDDVTIYKEFCINVDSDPQTIQITFTPSSGGTGTYAFINGIEIISMPTNLYYSSAGTTGFKFMDQSNPYLIETKTAMQTMHRINIGGGAVDPNGDTGMFRRWVKDTGEFWLEGGFLPVNLYAEIKYTKSVPDYTAPVSVYQSAKTMGNNRTENYLYNLTIRLPVDPSFTYMVRLHFCEFQSLVNTTGDRQFTIYINNQTAEPQADVIQWSGGNSMPTYRDYAVMITGSEKKQYIFVALHPNPVDQTRYSDAILNGLELFKLSSSDGNLAGPNPDPLPTSPKVRPVERKKSWSKLVFVLVGVLGGVLGLSLLGYLVLHRRMRFKDVGAGTETGSHWGPISFTNMTKATVTSNASLPVDLCRYFTLSEILTATGNFDDDLVIGIGGFGNVYKGYIDGGSTPVAIKRLNPESKQGANEFRMEIEMLSQLRHLHLVSLIGYCNEEKEMILVYDYMARGTLRDHLYKTKNPPLPWEQRLDLCIGAARGLHYLHTGAKNTIIHRDVKTTNILIDEKWVAKVSDIGLSKMGLTSASNAPVSTVVKGTFGYLDPEYFRRQQLTEKSDVYSFGVVLFEVLCARQPLNQKLVKDQVNLAEWAKECFRKGKLEKILDPNLVGKIRPECLKKFAEIAADCLDDEGIKRPSMGDVVWRLEFALQVQQGNGSYVRKDTEEVPLKEGWTDGDDDVFTSSGVYTPVTGTTISTSDSEKSEGKLLTGAVFSEIMNPRAR